MQKKSRERERRSFFNWRFLWKERRKGYRFWALALLASIPGFFLSHQYVLATGRVTDVSMLPTLSEGQIFLIHKWIYHLHRPQRGDVVVFRPPRQDRWRYVKRVIAAEGDSIFIREGTVFLNGEPLKEPYARGRTTPEMESLSIPAGTCFVLGDNRPESEDSRQFGPLPLSRIEGKLQIPDPQLHS